MHQNSQQPTLPERHIKKGDPVGHCLAPNDACCAEIGAHNHSCYRAHCFATARALARQINWPAEKYTVSFQSRLGRTPWIGPNTEEVLREFPGRGVKKLAVLCPSFTADCLETVEEMGIRGVELFKAAGGEQFHLVPCVNSDPGWVDAVVNMVTPALNATPRAPRRLPLLADGR